MKKILVNYLGRKGGGALYAYEMTKGLIENGNEVYAVVSEGIENLELWKRLSLKKLILLKTYHNMLSFCLGLFRFWLVDRQRIKKQFKEVQIDACYIPMIQPWSEFINGIFRKAKLIVTLHDPKPHHGSSNIMNFLYNRVVKAADEIVILSEAFRDFTCMHYGKENEQVHVIPHGIFDFYQNIKEVTPYNYKKGKVNFLFFGRICEYKGLDVLAKSYSLVKEKCSDVALTIVGSGNFSLYEDDYRCLNDITVINKWIPDEDVASYFRSDERVILVLPYTDATQSGVIPVAMSSGVPVIASDTGGLSEQIKDGVTGFLCKPNDAQALAECMIKVMNSDNATIVDNAIEYIKSLDWRTLSKRLGDIME